MYLYKVCNDGITNNTRKEKRLETIYGNLKNIPKLFYAQGIIWIWDDISLVNGIRYKMSIAYFSSNENEM